MRGLPPAATRGATMYCTLEPCCGRWEGKLQPPCAEAIIQSGIKAVYIASIDPNPRVHGGGLRVLREAGVRAELVPGFEAASRDLNEAFHALLANKFSRPFVHVKIAQSADARMAAADGSSAWITNASSRQAVHAMRAETHMIISGAGTIAADNPQYTARQITGPKIIQPRGLAPALAIFDARLRTSPTAACFAAARRSPGLVIFTSTQGFADTRKRAALETRGATVIALPEEKKSASSLAHGTAQQQQDRHNALSIRAALKACISMGVYSVMVEAGPRLTSSFLAGPSLGSYADKASFFIAPMLLGGGAHAQGGYCAGETAASMRFARRLFYSSVSVMKRDEDPNAEAASRAPNALVSGYLRDIFTIEK